MSLVHPEIVYPNKRYEAYCFKVPESRPVAQYKPVSNYEMDGLRPRIDLRPGAEVPVLKMMWMLIPTSMNTQHKRSLWRGRIRFPARSLPKYVPRSMVEARVMPVSTRRRPTPSRPCR